MTSNIHNSPGRQKEQAHDASGYRIFSNGGLGEAHKLAHQMLDQ